MRKLRLKSIRRNLNNRVFRRGYNSSKRVKTKKVTQSGTTSITKLRVTYEDTTVKELATSTFEPENKNYKSTANSHDLSPILINIIVLLFYLGMGWGYYLMFKGPHTPFAVLCELIGVVILVIQTLKKICTLQQPCQWEGAMSCFVSLLVAVMAFSRSAWLILPIPLLLGIISLIFVGNELDKEEKAISNRSSTDPNYVEKSEDSRGLAAGCFAAVIIVVFLTIICTILLTFLFFCQKELFV